jgi:protein phosphatase
VIGGNGVNVECLALELRDGDRLLMCSDGLTEMVPDEAIAAALAADPEPEAATKKLLAQANDAGGRDNITIVVVRFDQAPQDARAA